MRSHLSSNSFRITPLYAAVTLLAVLASWLVHEWAHYITGTVLGSEMTMTLNSTYPSARSYPDDSYANIVSAAGPLITLLEAVVVFMLMRSGRRPLLYPFLFVCFYMRLLATVVSFLNPNDEARISTSLGIGKFTLPVLVTAFLFYLLYKTAQRYNLSRGVQLFTLAVIMLVTSAIILSDQFFNVKLLS